MTVTEPGKFSFLPITKSLHEASHGPGCFCHSWCGFHLNHDFVISRSVRASPSPASYPCSRKDKERSEMERHPYKEDKTFQKCLSGLPSVLLPKLYHIAKCICNGSLGNISFFFFFNYREETEK